MTENTKKEDIQPKDAPEQKDALTPNELGGVTGGLRYHRTGGDPCEGGELE